MWISNRFRSFEAWITVLVVGAGCVGAIAQIPSAVPPQAVTSPQFKPTQEQIGDSLMAHQRYQAAIEAYRKVPDQGSVTWNKMGLAFQLMLNTDEAARCYRKAIKLDDRNAIAINNLGSIFMAKKDYAKAERTYRKALKLDPKSALIHKNLGTALLSEKKYQKGWNFYQQALALDPAIFDRNSNIHVENPASIQDRGAMNFYMAKTCVRAGMVARAIDYLRLALNEGFTTPKKIMADTELAVLRDMPAFQQLLASQGVYLTRTPPSPAVQQ